MQIGMKALPEDYKIKTFSPKLHTIRQDDNNRWKAGVMIDFFINPRQKNMFRFAPRIAVISTQIIEITNLEHKKYVHINGRKLSAYELGELAINDGFKDTTSFFEYFSECFSGKLIHWTDYSY